MEASGSRFLRAAEFLRGHRRWVATILALTAGTALLSAAEPLVLKYVFDALEVGHAGRALAVGIGALIGLGLVREGLVAQTATLTWRTRLAVHQSLLEAMVGRLHRLPLSFYRNEGVGAIMTRLERGVQGFVEAASQAALGILPALVYLLIALAVMFSLEWRLALVVLVLSPVPPLIAGWAAPVQTERERALPVSWMRIYSRFNEVISGIVTVKSFTREDEEKQRFIDDVARANQRVVQGVAFDSRVLAGQNLAVTLARAAALGVGGVLVLRGETSVGTLVAFLSYVSGAFAPLQGLSGVYAHEFVSRLPQGYDTMVGERGGRLSVGERQRVAIARALLKNPAILIFDEATSAVDAETESLIQEAVDRLVRGRTTFLIAHRLATVVNADRVCVLRGGRITAALPHAELLRKDEYYAMLVERQSRGLLPQLPAYPVPRRRAEDAAEYGFRP